MADPTPQTDCHDETFASTCPLNLEEEKRPSFSRLAGLLVALVVLIADRASKLWFLAHWHDAGVLTLAPVLDFRLVWNPGISLGLLQDGGMAITVVTALITATVAVWLWRLRDRGETLALGLVLGGALGNLWDRLHYGAVVDFVHFHVGGWSFYVFNLADAALSVGAGGMILLSLRQMRRAGRQQRG